MFISIKSLRLTLILKIKLNLRFLRKCKKNIIKILIQKNFLRLHHLNLNGPSLLRELPNPRNRPLELSAHPRIWEFTTEAAESERGAGLATSAHRIRYDARTLDAYAVSAEVQEVTHLSIKHTAHPRLIFD